MSLDRARSDLAAIEAEIGNLKALLHERQERADKLRTFIELASEYGPINPGTSSDFQIPETSADSLNTLSPALSENSPYFGKSLGAAALLVLGQSKEPLTAGEIVKTLKTAGWHFVSSNPQQATYWALRKTGEAVAVPGSKWALTGWRPDHVAKSSAGLDAARLRGVQLGPPKKMTDEKVVKLREMVAAGISVSEISDKLGVSRQTIYKYKLYLKESIGDAPGQEYLGPNVTRLVR